MTVISFSLRICVASIPIDDSTVRICRLTQYQNGSESNQQKSKDEPSHSNLRPVMTSETEKGVRKNLSMVSLALLLTSKLTSNFVIGQRISCHVARYLPATQRFDDNHYEQELVWTIRLACRGAPESISSYGSVLFVIPHISIYPGVEQRVGHG